MPYQQRQNNPRRPRHDAAEQRPARASRREVDSPAAAELVALLPPLAAATLLVDNYFDRVHWFMLVFHQSDFRGLFSQLYRDLDKPSQRQPTSVGLGFLSVFAAVCIVSLRYIDASQRAILSQCGISPDDLQQQLLTTLRMRLLEIVAQGRIEAVQVCVLLGSFHLYHGEPELAWPICGCGLRIAQALNLHRRRPLLPRDTCTHGPPDLDDPAQRAEETRKRCWWAVYEMEATCSMLYGFPLSINDDDCDVQLIHPYPLRSGDASWDPAARQESGQATLLSYKHAMAQLSVIVKSALTDLYGLRQRRVHSSGSSGAADRHRLQGLMASVTSIDKRLRQWHARLPLQLRPESLTDARGGYSEALSSHSGLNAPSEKAFEHHLFQLQALSLKVAFENAKILIHRPLLSYRMVAPPTNKNATAAPPTTPDSCQSSIQICRDAALGISNIGSLPVFQGVADTYAVSFVSLHLLTAAIALSILTTLTPLTQESHDCKMGIRRLMEMQSRLRARSIVAEQGLGILKKLMSLVLTKEMKEMLEFPRPGDEHATAAAVTDVRGAGDNLGGAPRELEAGEDPEACEAASRLEGRSANRVPVDAAPVIMPEAAAGGAASPGFSFYEDATITQAMLDFEQGMLSAIYPCLRRL